MNPGTVVLLVVGYPLAIAGILRLRRTFRQRDTNWFLVEVAGTAAIVGGWLLHGRLSGVMVNGAWLAAVVVAWWWTGRRRSDAVPPG